MEHEIERIIREKLNKEDHAPVVWRKKEVWSSVENNITRKKFKLIDYSVAASVALLVAFLLYNFERDDNPFATVATSVETTSPQTKSEKDVAQTRPSLVFKDDQTSRLPVTLTKVINQARESSIDTATLNNSVLNTENITIIQVSSANEIDSLPVKGNEPVHAIFGIEETSAVVDVKKSKKLRFRFFKTEESSSPVDVTDNASNLFASINKK